MLQLSLMIRESIRDIVYQKKMKIFILKLVLISFLLSASKGSEGKSSNINIMCVIHVLNSQNCINIMNFFCIKQFLRETLMDMKKGAGKTKYVANPTFYFISLPLNIKVKYRNTN